MKDFSFSKQNWKPMKLYHYYLCDTVIINTAADLHLNIYWMPGTVLNALHPLLHSSLTSASEAHVTVTQI